MAHILTSGTVVAAINGTADGIVFYRGRWGPTARQWVNPTNTITPQRTAVRTAFASLITLFNSLTAAMQDDWNDAAHDYDKFTPLGQKFIQTGLNLFISHNMNLLTIGNIPNLLPLPPERLIPMSVFSCNSLTVASMIMDGLTYDNTNTIPANYYQVISSSLDQPAHKRNQTNRLRVTSIDIPGNPYNNDIIGQWLLAWPGNFIVPGRRYFFRSVLINGNTGQATKPIYTSQLAT